MQAFTAGVERQRSVIFGNVDIQANVRIAHRDVGACACLFAKPVYDGIFHFVGDKAGVAELFRIDHRVHREGLFVVKVVAPFYLLYLVVNFFCRTGLESVNGLEYADGSV